MAHEEKTLYIADLDGTLLNENAELSAYTKAALAQMIAEGIHFSVATGRTAATASRILEDIAWNIPVVLFSGVLVYDMQAQRYLRVISLPVEAVREIIEVLQRLHMTGLMYQLKDGAQTTYYETQLHQPIRDFMEERRVRYNKPFQEVTSFADVPLEEIVFFTLLDAYEKIEQAEAALKGIAGIELSISQNVYQPELWYLEIHGDQASKKNGVHYLKEKYGFQKVIGFGDNLNDLPLFAACDTAVAVKNAREEVKAAADDVCEANVADGVVKWIFAHHTKSK
ncbi:MAG: HAD family hydrolase [Christensenellaceae bacterium]|jgi:Cof subfamily protein (haloacid dehalogenase superfamily)